MTGTTNTVRQSLREPHHQRTHHRQKQDSTPPKAVQARFDRHTQSAITIENSPRATNARPARIRPALVDPGAARRPVARRHFVIAVTTPAQSPQRHRRQRARCDLQPEKEKERGCE